MAFTKLEEWDETPLNNTEMNGIDLQENVMRPPAVNNEMREHMAQVAKWLGADTLASASTTDLGSVAGRYVYITGTTTITAFGTIKEGTIKYVKFSGALTLTHNATSLILQGAANRAIQAGDTGIYVSEGSGNWREIAFQSAVVGVMVVQERKADGTAGGGNTGGSWTQRALSDAIVNTIPGATFSDVSDSFTLPAGTYDFFVSAPMYKVNGHRCRLYNLTAAATSLLGTSAYSDSANNVESTSVIAGRVTITTASEFIIESRGTATQATNGLGVAANTGDQEIYTTVRVDKVA